MPTQRKLSYDVLMETVNDNFMKLQYFVLIGLFFIVLNVPYDTFSLQGWEILKMICQ